jgi:hypothetical protein
LSSSRLGSHERFGDEALVRVEPDLRCGARSESPRSRRPPARGRLTLDTSAITKTQHSRDGSDQPVKLPLSDKGGHQIRAEDLAPIGARQRPGLRNETACAIRQGLVPSERADYRSPTAGGRRGQHSRCFCSGNGLGSARFWLVRFFSASGMRGCRRWRQGRVSKRLTSVLRGSRSVLALG